MVNSEDEILFEGKIPLNMVVSGQSGDPPVQHPTRHHVLGKSLSYDDVVSRKEPTQELQVGPRPLFIVLLYSSLHGTKSQITFTSALGNDNWID